MVAPPKRAPEQRGLGAAAQPPAANEFECGAIVCRDGKTCRGDALRAGAACGPCLPAPRHETGSRPVSATEFRAGSSTGRALAPQARGWGFDSPPVHQV